MFFGPFRRDRLFFQFQRRPIPSCIEFRRFLLIVFVGGTTLPIDRQSPTNTFFQNPARCHRIGYGRLNSLSIHWNHSGRLCFEMNYKNSDRQAWFLQHAIANT